MSPCRRDIAERDQTYVELPRCARANLAAALSELLEVHPGRLVRLVILPCRDRVAGTLDSVAERGHLGRHRDSDAVLTRAGHLREARKEKG